jgi:uncharacterized membrane protein YfcA
MTAIAGIIFISFLATLIRSTFGFGESLVAVPLFSLLMPVSMAVPLSVLVSVLVALVVVVQDHRKIELKSARWLILSALPGIPLGVWALAYGDPAIIKIVLGLLVVAYALYALLARFVFRLEKDSRSWLLVCGFLSGVFGGAFGINGPPLAVYGNLRSWDAKTFRATLQAYFLPASLLGLAGYYWKGLIGGPVLHDFLICLPAALPAIFLGRWLNHRLQGDRFYRYVYFGLLAVGAVLLFS